MVLTNKGREWAKAQLEVAKTKYSDVSEQLDEFAAELQGIREMATGVVQDLDGKLDWEKFVDALFEELKSVVRSIETEFELPLPDDMDERTRLREERIKRVLDQAIDAFFRVLEEQGIIEDNDEMRSKVDAIKKVCLHVFMVASGSLASFSHHLIC